MIEVKAYAVNNPKDSFKPFNFQRREVGANDVLIDILYCGVCHSDVHQVRDEWGNAVYPMVPGHEIVGKVRQVGANVSQFKSGDIAAVGCMVDSCQECASCADSLEQYCENGFVHTYNGVEKDGKTPTQGGYSNCIVVDEKFCLTVDPSQQLDGVAPLLCAGITTYSPLKHWDAGPGKKVGVIGLGGLGHMAVKIAHAMGAEVTLFTQSSNKVEDGKRLGADHVVITSDPNVFASCANQLDLIINTVSAKIPLEPYMNCLKREGTLVLLGVPETPAPTPAMPLIFKRCNLAGSLIGGIAQTQEMLDFCAKHNITADIELIPMQQINQAYDRMVNSDVKYRFVIDMSTLGINN